MSDPVARAQNAQRLLEDPLFQEAFKAIEDAILNQLKGPATPQDAELLMAMRLVPKIKAWLIGVVETGKVELYEREQKK